MRNDIFIVGLIPEPAKGLMFDYQFKISRIYDLYEEYYPELHLTLARLHYKNPEQIIKLSNKLIYALEHQKPLKVNIQGTSCFDSPYKSVNFHIKTTKALLELSNSLIEWGKAAGLTCEYDPDQWKYHISIASPAFAQKEWSEAEYNQACTLLTNENFTQAFTLKNIELWIPAKENYVKGRYSLEGNSI